MNATALRFDEVRRGHAADAVFRQLAAAILRGDLAPGSVLPPERVLEERFGVSRVIARSAVHRLDDLGLVRVRQGGATLVLDPNEANDVRVLALFYELTPAAARSEANAFDMIEKQYLQGLSIVEAASRRAPREALESIAALIEAVERDEARLKRFSEFEEQFWRALAVASSSRVFRIEVAFWYESIADRPVPDAVAKTPPRTRIAFHREIVRRLVARDHAAEYYLAVVRPILDAITPKPKTRSKSSKPSKRRPR